jgi:hypothetical protein
MLSQAGTAMARLRDGAASTVVTVDTQVSFVE